MVFLAAAAIVVQPAALAPRPVSALVQATATIRVISAVRLKLDSDDNPGAPRPRETAIRTADGLIQPAKLIEFE